MKRFTILFVFVLVYGFYSCNGGGSANIDGRQMPEFESETLAGGTLSHKYLQGKVVLVDFWATNCPPCKESIPHLQKMYEKYKDKGLVIVGISLDRPGTSNEYIKKFLDDRKATYPVIRDDGTLIQAFGLPLSIRIPTFLLIDQQGMIVGSRTGFAHDIIIQNIEALLETGE